MIKDENYFVVHGWMRNRLNLKGLDLDVYAVLYGFSQDGESEFRGTVKYIMDFTGSGRTAVKNSLNRLAENQLIRKVERNQKTGEPNGYICTPLEELYVILQGSRNTTRGVVGKRLGGGRNATTPWSENDHHYKEIYKENYIISSKQVNILKEKELTNSARVCKTFQKEDYNDLLDSFAVYGEYRNAIFRFIGHLKVNFNLVMLNDRLENLIIRLDMQYVDDIDKARAIDDAIVKGYKRLECESA